jgi:protein TonB
MAATMHPSLPEPAPRIIQATLIESPEAAAPLPVPAAPAAATKSAARKSVQPLAEQQKTPAPAQAPVEHAPDEIPTEGPAETLATAAPVTAVAAAEPVAYLDNPKPVYPVLARRMHFTGTTLLHVHVAHTGYVSEARVMKSSGHEMLDHSARDAVMRWRFRPATIAGGPVAAWVEVPVRFSLENAR